MRLYILYICRPKCLQNVCFPNVLSPNHVAQVPVAQTSCRLNVCRPNVCTQFYRTDLWQTHSSTRLRLTHWSIGSDGVRKKYTSMWVGSGRVHYTDVAFCNREFPSISYVLIVGHEQQKAVADLQTKPTDLSRHSVCRLLSSTLTIAVY